MATTDNMTTTTTDNGKAVFLPFDAKEFLSLVLIKSKGTAHGIEAFKGFAGLFSQALQGGMRVELDSTSATLPACIMAYTSPLKEVTAAGKAFRKVAPLALAAIKAAPSRAKLTQAQHDAIILEISAHWAGCFKDVAAKVKNPSVETSVQKISRLEAENVALRIERDALQLALNAKNVDVTA